MDEDCLFCKIIAGESPADVVYEDDSVIAFLDIRPVNPGHTLVVPKEHFKDFQEMSDEAVTNVFQAAKKISKGLKKSVDADGINIAMNNGPAAGQIVFHAHVHVIPRHNTDGYAIWPGKAYEEGQAKDIAQKMKENL